MSFYRSGFTLVEMIVCISMAGVLAGVALPVLNVSRGDQRQVECAMRLTEITLGSLEFQEVNSRMPPLSNGDGPSTSIQLNDDQNTGALAHILPFIGQQDLFDLMPGIATQSDIFLSPATSPFVNFAILLDDKGMRAAINEQVPYFVCPANADLVDKRIDRLFYGTIQDISNPSTLFITSFNVGETLPKELGRTSYLPSVGGHHTQYEVESRAIDLSLEDAAGALRNRTTSIHTTQIGDGASNTICWSESLGYDTEFDVIYGGNNTVGASSALLSNSLITGSGWIVDNPLNAIWFGDQNNSLQFLIGSNHVAGNNVTFCDGSVRFLSNRTSRGVMMALGCSNDGWGVERGE